MLRPLLHFLVIGTLLFAADRVRTELTPRDGALGTVTLDAATLERLTRESVVLTGRAPSERQLDARAAQWADEEVLFREARRIGLVVAATAARGWVFPQRIVQRWCERDQASDDDGALSQ